MNYKSGVVNPKIPSRAMASLLADVNPKKLSELRNQFPDHVYLFDVSYTLGESKIDKGSTTGSDVVGLSALRALIEETISVSGPSIEKIQFALTSRIMSARRTRLGGSIIAMVSSAGVVASITASAPSTAIAVSILALFGSVAMLVGEHLEKPVIGGDKSLHELLSNAIVAESSFKEVNIRLLSEDLGKIETLVDIAKKVNKISATIKEASVFSGISLTT